MEKTSAPFVDQQLRDTDPTVAIDIRLGKKYGKNKVINFDYERFRHTSQVLGGETDNSGFSMTIEPMGCRVPGTKGTGGEYSIVTDSASGECRYEVRLNSNLLNSEAALQKSLQHELMHHIDLQANPPTEAEVSPTKRRLGNVAYRALNIVGLPAAVVINGLGTVGAIMEKNPHYITHPLYLSTAAGVAALVGASRWYHGDKRELIAQKAEDFKLDPVITVSKRPRK